MATITRSDALRPRTVAGREAVVVDVDVALVGITN